MAKSIKVRAIDIKRMIAAVSTHYGLVPVEFVGKSGALLAKGRYYVAGLMQVSPDAMDLEILRALTQYHTGGVVAPEQCEKFALYQRCIIEGRDPVLAGCDGSEVGIMRELGLPVENPSTESTGVYDECEDEAEPEEPDQTGVTPLREVLVSELGGLPTLEEMRPLIQSQIDAMGLTGKITVEEFSDIWA